MSKRALFTQSDVERAARALKAVGEKIGGVDIRPDGSFRILTSAEVPDEPTSELKRWRQARAGRAA